MGIRLRLPVQPMALTVLCNSPYLGQGSRISSIRAN